MTQQRKLDKSDIELVVKRIKFKYNKFIVLEKGDGFLVQMSYYDRDVEDSDTVFKVKEQKTRKWYISPYMTISEIVETCFAMVCRSQLHIAGEYFTYCGRRVYSPHFDVGARIHMCDENRFDKRTNLSEASEGDRRSERE